MKRYVRLKSRIIGSIGMPLFFLLFLGLGLNSVVTIPGLGQDYTQFIIPGIVCFMVTYTSFQSGIQILWDKQFGFLKEILVAPVSRFAVVLGQTLGGATTAFLQGIIIVVISLFIGLHGVTIPGFLIAFGFMALIGIAFTAFGIAMASRMEDPTGYQFITSFIVLPIFGLSGAIFPISSLPAWIAPITLCDPLTYGVEGIRYGLTGVSQINPLLCLAALGSFAIVMTIVGAFLFSRMNY